MGRETASRSATSSGCLLVKKASVSTFDNTSTKCVYLRMQAQAFVKQLAEPWLARSKHYHSSDGDGPTANMRGSVCRTQGRHNYYAARRCAPRSKDAGSGQRRRYCELTAWVRNTIIRQISGRCRAPCMRTRIQVKTNSTA